MVYKLLKFDNKIKPKNVNEVIAYLFECKGFSRINTTYNPLTGKKIGYTYDGNMNTRSYQDVFSLCKYYFKNTKRENIKEIMYKLKDNKILSRHFCNTCKRNVYQSTLITISFQELLNKINKALK